MMESLILHPRIGAGLVRFRAPIRVPFHAGATAGLVRPSTPTISGRRPASSFANPLRRLHTVFGP